MAPRILMGLGNPGAQYVDTRHNLGFKVVERVAAALKVKLAVAGEMRVGTARRGGFTAVLVEPLTYVNLSGDAAIEVLDRHGAEPEDLLVVVDDMSLKVGQVRIRAKGSDGGHNGLRSIIEGLGTERFPRLRIGIGQPPETGGDTRDYVLGAFEPPESDRVEEGLALAAEAAERWLRDGDIQKIMNRYNRRAVTDDEASSDGRCDGES